MTKPNKAHITLGNYDLPDPTELAWAAGFFDGEGTTHGRRLGQSRIHVSVSVAQSDRRPLERFHKAVGGIGNIHGPYKGINSTRDAWVYAATAQQDCIAVLHHLWPYLGEPKREQAEPVKTLIFERWTEPHYSARSIRPNCKRGGHPRSQRSNGTWFCPECSRVSWRRYDRRRRGLDETQ